MLNKTFKPEQTLQTWIFEQLSEIRIVKIHLSLIKNKQCRLMNFKNKIHNA